MLGAECQQPAAAESDVSLVHRTDFPRCIINRIRMSFRRIRPARMMKDLLAARRFVQLR